MKKVAVAFALTLGIAQGAHAYTLSCGDFRDAFVFGSTTDQALVVSHALGVADMLGGLLCFGGDRRCGCVSNIGAIARDFGAAVAQRVLDCPRGDPAFGAAFNGALDVCR